MGSIRSARRAGTQQAARATRAMISATEITVAVS